jgi:hypothetical protein
MTASQLHRSTLTLDTRARLKQGFAGNVATIMNVRLGAYANYFDSVNLPVIAEAIIRLCPL